MTNARRLAVGSSWAFLGKIGALAFVFVSNMILARVMAPVELGTYFLVLSIARVAVLVGQVGMNQVVVRYIAGSMASGESAKARQTITKASAIVGAGSSTIGLLYVIFDYTLAYSFFNSPVMATVGGLVFIWIIAGAFRILAAECFRGFHDLKLASLFELLIFEFLFAVFVVWAWFVKGAFGFQEAILFSAIAATLSALLAMVLLRKKFVSLPVGQNVEAGELLKVGWPLLVSNLVVVVMTQAGLWVVGIVASSSDVALYGAAFRLVMVLQLPLLVFNAVIPQMIAELHSQEKNREIERSLRLVAMTEFIPITFMFGILLLWGDRVLSLIFGSFYGGGYLILIILGGGVIVNAWAGFCGPALMMTGNQLSLMKISLFCGMLALIAAFFLGHRFGAEGVAGAMALGIAGQHVLMVFAAKRHLGVWTFAGNMSGLVRRVTRCGL